MYSACIKETKTFMKKLLIEDAFDEMLLYSADVDMFCRFHIDGQRNFRFYDKEETEEKKEALTEYVSWAESKKYVYEVIKGNKVPSAFVIVFISSESDRTIEKLINVRYKDGHVTLVSAVNHRQFTMDKTEDKAWDEALKDFLNKKGIDFEDQE